MYHHRLFHSLTAHKSINRTKSHLRNFHSSPYTRDTLVIAEHENVKLGPGTLPSISAAMAFQKPVDVLVIGHNCGDVVKQVSSVSGPRKVFVVDHEEFLHPTAERCTDVIMNMQNEGKYTHIVCASGTFGKNVIPRLGAFLDVQPISEVQQILSEDTFVRPIYAGNALQTVQSEDPVKVMTVRTTSFEAAPLGNGETQVVKIDPPAPTKIVSKWLSENTQKSERPELQSANIVISGGRALKSGENFSMLYELADKLNAAVGASRAAVDAGFVPNDMQVGQTGKIVAPQLYVAVGISGAIQHLAGMKDSKVIVAINSDPDAPIFQLADYGLVGDLFKIVPEFTKLVDKK